MKLTQEDIESITEEVEHAIRFKSFKHLRDNLFVLITPFLLDRDLCELRRIGLSVEGIDVTPSGKEMVGKWEVDAWSVKLDLEYIGPHRVIMGC